MSFMKWIGIGPSNKTIDTDTWPGNTERYYGLENFGNTCYCNSILQALYHCPPFRDCVLGYPQYYLSDQTSVSGDTAVVEDEAVTADTTRNRTDQANSVNQPTDSAATLLEVAKENGIPASSPNTNRNKGSRSPHPPFRRLNSARGLNGQASANNGNGLAEPPLTRAQSYNVMSLARSSKSGSSGTPANNASGLTPNLPPHMSATSMGVTDSMFTALKDLFYALSVQKKRTGVYSPNSFIQKLRKENEIYRSTMHQDAHEFLNYILNAIMEDVTKIQSRLLARRGSVNSVTSENGHSDPIPTLSSGRGSTTDSNPSSVPSTSGGSGPPPTNPVKMWVHTLFEGELTNETKCLTCETVSSRKESFLDLSIDIDDHSSVTSCLRQFSASELLCQRNKFFCDQCGGLQEAEKRMKIQKLPNILALHLKRFKYQEHLGRYMKLNCRVVFPMELRLPNTTERSANPDRLYSLFAVCVHIGGGPNQGHYVSVVKSHDQWILFDDDTVELIEEDHISHYFGDYPRAGSGYLLFYQANDLDPAALDLPRFGEESPPASFVLPRDPLTDDLEGSTSTLTQGASGATWESDKSVVATTDTVSKRSSSLFIPRNGDSLAISYAKTRSPSLHAASCLDQTTLRDSLTDLPPDQPAQIPVPGSRPPNQFVPPLISNAYRSQSPANNGWRSQPNSHLKSHPTPPNVALPVLPRSPSRVHYKRDDKIPALTPPLAPLPLMHRTRSNDPSMSPETPEDGTQSGRLNDNHLMLPYGSAPSATTAGGIPSISSLSTVPPRHNVLPQNGLRRSPLSTLPPSPDVASDLSGSLTLSRTGGNSSVLTPSRPSLNTLPNPSSLATTFSNPSSWFSRRDPSSATTNGKSKESTKFWKPMSTKHK
ncbi:hypothetical protein IWQ61_003404 [Dispira simplex]|nr:hypothetical protein IWQ61_003404 [Dispira simplex]